MYLWILDNLGFWCLIYKQEPGVYLYESRGYYAFVIILLLPLQRFLVCAPYPAALKQYFSDPGHMSLVPKSRRQLVLGDSICGHWGAKWVFNRFSSYSHQICIGPLSRRQLILGALCPWPLATGHWGTGCKFLCFLWTLQTPEVSTDIFF